MKLWEFQINICCTFQYSLIPKRSLDLRCFLLKILPFQYKTIAEGNIKATFKNYSQNIAIPTKKKN